MPRGLKGVVLAAGLGTRLRPLTDRYAKPLIPFAGSTPLELALWRLAQLGVKDVAINSHHHADQIAAAVAANPFRQNLKLSHEPEILGTGGVYNPLRSWQGHDDLLVINGDIISTIDLGALCRRHQESAALATMALLPAVIPGESAVFHQNDVVVGIGKTPPAGGAAVQAGNYGCIQILSRAFVDLLPTSGTFDVINAGYLPALAHGLKISAYVHQGFWHDIRTPQFYWLALKDYLASAERDPSDPVGLASCHKQRQVTFERRGTVLVNAASRIAPSAKLGPFVIVEGGCEIGADVLISDSLLLPGARVVEGAVVKNAIIGKDLRIALG